MIAPTRPLPHVLPQVDAIRGYITQVAEAFDARNLDVRNVWLDPMNPRDATFILRTHAVVWNESEGFVKGRFVSGAPGERTVLADPVKLGGGVLLEPGHAAWLLESDRVERPTVHRPYTARDGLDDSLAGY
ncbi:hypothetical protein SMC26_42365 [Actinomadura fulvescens]|uniref:Uncharacterized protein n=1 Tax=Actinomadura fulvescens TaxID=46160 RepID=A0ABN3P849_9ACTN